MSARLIPDRRDRLATILVAPFMSCSARLPVYVLLTSMLFVGQPLSRRSRSPAATCSARSRRWSAPRCCGRTLVKGTARPMVLELPSYKVPSFTNALLTAQGSGLRVPEDRRHRDHGDLRRDVVAERLPDSAAPRRPRPRCSSARRDRGDQAAAQALLGRGRRARRRARSSSNSFAGRIGRIAQPVFAPLGYDWQLTVGVLTSFLAREVFVSTMSVLLGGTDDPESPTTA